MKKKLIIIAVIAVIGATVIIHNIYNPFNIGITPLQTASGQEQTGRRLEIYFSYDKLLLVASSQYAFWIEDMDGNYVDTLYVTQWTAQGGYRSRPKSIPVWVAARPVDMLSSEIDAVAGATPKPGDYLVVWDFTDRNGNPVTGTKYRYIIEATLYNDEYVIYTDVITIGEVAWSYNPIPEYNVPDSEHKAMITNVQVSYYPN